MLTGSPDPGGGVGVDDGADDEVVDMIGIIDEVETTGGIDVLDTTGVDDDGGTTPLHEPNSELHPRPQ